MCLGGTSADAKLTRKVFNSKMKKAENVKIRRDASETIYLHCFQRHLLKIFHPEFKHRLFLYKKNAKAWPCQASAASHAEVFVLQTLELQ